MNWVCLEDRTPLALEPAGAGLRCPRCGARHPVVDGIPSFLRRAGLPVPALEELWRALSAGEGDALERFFQAQGVAEQTGPASLRLLVPLPPPGLVLELGAGLGTARVAPAAGPLVSVVPGLTHGRILGRASPPSDTRAILVLDDLSRLPLADSSVGLILFDDAALGGFGLNDARLGEVAAEWRRVLVPGGRVVLGLTNGWLRLPGIERARRALRSRAHLESADRRVRRLSAAGRAGSLGIARTTRTLVALGFERQASFAPLPDGDAPEILLPLEDRRVARYFLTRLVRRNSWAVRWALALARPLAAAGLGARLVPYRYLLFSFDPERGSLRG